MRPLLLAAILGLVPASVRADPFDDLSSKSGASFVDSAPAPRAVPKEPRDSTVGWDLSQIVERKRMDKDKHAALLAVGGFDPKREPLILIHGIFGSPADLQPVAERLRGDRFQVFVLAYADFTRGPALSGKDLAEEVAALRRRLGGAGRPMTIIAHSMGGIVARAALNDLAASGELGAWGKVRAICVDTPWHGYPGPGTPMDLPGAFDDMRAKSPMYAKGLLKKPLGDNVELELVFAQQGTLALDYTEGELAELPAKLALYYSKGTAVTGGAQLKNFWQALIWSSHFLAFRDELEAKADKGPLDAAAVKDSLLRHYPRFPGDHTGVLGVKGPGSLLEHLASELEP